MTSLKQEKTLILLFCFALALRLIMVKWTYVTANDGVVYIAMARDFFSGDFAAFIKNNSHPLYPILIGIGEKAIQDWELAGKVVSAITGSLLIIPFFIWGRKNLGEKAAFFSTIFLAVSPYHVRYSADVITESTYILFFFLATIFSINAVFKKKPMQFFYAGLFTGMAFLTRPEGAVLVFLLIVWTMFSKFPSWRRKIAALLVLLLSLSIFAFPYMLYLRLNYNRWLITAKYDVSAITGLNDSTSGTKRAVAEDKESQKVPRKYFMEPIYNGLKENLIRLAYLGKRFAVTYHPLITLLLLYGIIRRKIQWRENRANFYLLTVIAIYMIILFRIHVLYDWFGRRHILPLSVLALYWAGMSFDHFIEGLKKFIRDRRSAYSAHPKKITAFCLIIALLIILPKALKPQRMDKLPEKRVGLWLGKTTDKPPTIITNMSRVSFYAEGINHELHGWSYEHLINYAQKHDVDYIVVNENVEKIYPDFFSKARAKRLKLVLKEGGGKEEKVFVYQFK